MPHETPKAAVEKKTEVTRRPSEPVQKAPEAKHDDNFLKAQDLLQAKQNQTKGSKSKPTSGKDKKDDDQSKSHKKKKTKTFEEREQESSQLDNLFLTLREDLIEGHKEERKRKSHKKKAGKNKQRKHRKGKRSRAFIEIEESAPVAANLLQLSRVDSSDMAVDEGAELALKRMANKMEDSGKYNEDKSDVSADSKATEGSDSGDSETEKEPKGLAGADRAHDTALRTALREADAEESLQKAEAGPDSRSSEKYKTDSYTNKVSKRLVEEAVEERRLKKLEDRAFAGDSAASSSGKNGAATIDSKKDSAIKKLLEESDAEESLKKAEKNVDTSKDAAEDRSGDSSFVQMHSKAPASRTLVQLGSQVSA